MGERLKDKVALIVGAGQAPGGSVGNGRATSLVFAREGARLLLVDRDRDALEATREAVAAEGGEAQVLKADVTAPGAARAMVAAALERYGRLDVLQNNVGTLEGDRGVADLAEEVWDRVMDINLKATFLACQAALGAMIPRKGGAIVNVSSMASVGDWPLLAYKTSKAAVNSLTQSVAMAGAPYGVRANAVLPGLMATPFAIESIMANTGQSRDEVLASRDAQVPLKGVRGEGWDVANASLFLASDEARFITGALLPVDGGQIIAGGATRAVEEG